MENSLSNHRCKSTIVESGIPNKVKLGPNVYLGLRVKIGFAEDIDNPILHPYVVNRHYCLATWIDPSEEFRTLPALGLPDPVWDTECVFLLNKFPDDCTSLNLEVTRINSVIGAATSSGVVTVGKAMIPLPTQLYSRIAGRFGLVRPYGEGYKEEGHVALSMELRKYILTTKGTLMGVCN
ncbi:hypothetical protein RIF29_17506 [Crotalaria pallida]|uniref:Uncharacterized protein n=1 Tax=Crotalaria pallida TaxID=3830 RepID=A0AAN9IEL5_CROPI